MQNKVYSDYNPWSVNSSESISTKTNS